MKVAWLTIFMGFLIAGRSSAVLINFEAFPGPDGQLGTFDDIPIVAPASFDAQPEQVTDQFAPLGIEFLPDPPLNNQNEILNDVSFERTAGSANHLLSTSRGPVFPFGPIEARFTVPVYELTMAIGLGSDTSVRPNRLEIFDSNNAVIDSIVASDAFVTLSSSVPIDRFVVTATLSQHQAAIDDIQFTAVPEPHAIVILCAFVLCCSGRARRASHRKSAVFQLGPVSTHTPSAGAPDCG